MVDFGPRQRKQSRFTGALVSKQISFGPPTTDFGSVWSSQKHVYYNIFNKQQNCVFCVSAPNRLTKQIVVVFYSMNKAASIYSGPLWHFSPLPQRPLLLSFLVPLRFGPLKKYLILQPQLSRLAISRTRLGGFQNSQEAVAVKSTCQECFLLLGFCNVSSDHAILGTQSKHNCKRSADIRKIKLKQLTSRERMQNLSSLSLKN